VDGGQVDVMNSLRTRLFLSLTIVIVAAGLAAGALTYRWAFEEAIELQDSILTQIGAVARSSQQLSSALINRKVEPETRVTIEEIDGSNNASPDGRVLHDLKDGLHLVTRSNENWRFLVLTRPDKTRLAIGQPTVIRNEIARDTALRVALPMALLIPFLMLVVGLVIRQTLNPISQLAHKLDDSKASDLDTLPLKGMPTELRPFVASINRLLERIHVMVDQQRRFIADAAHELRSPITALSLQAENLDQVELPADSRSRLVVLKEGARRTAHLLDQLLALARSDLSNIAAQPITQVDQCAKDVMANLLPRARQRGIDLGFKILDPVSVRGDPAMLASLIRNLIDNAIRHTPEAGRIDVGLYQDGARAIFQVEDTGPGIPDAERERVFEPFYRGSGPVNDGTGLGLSIVKRVVARLNGSVQLENITGLAGSGLRATVSLPVTVSH
jgi:two-component system OmpR family sensor kinase